MKKYRINYFITKNNFENNVDKYTESSNVLFITGLSGSGKTTLSNELSKKYKSIILNLDCLQNLNNNFIIEGTQIFMTIDPLYFYDKPIIILGESAIRSLVRRLNRQLTIDEKRHPLSIGKKHIKKLLNDSKRLHYKDVKKLNYFISTFQKKVVK